MSKEKDSNELLNILLILIGILFILKAVMDFLGWAGIVVPSWLQGVSQGEAELTFFGTQALISTVLGFWAIVGGIGMFREQEWAYGISLVVLSIMAMTSLSSIITWISNPSSFDLLYWVNYIIILAFILGVIGFLWLLATKNRYH